MLGAPADARTYVANERSRTVREQGVFANTPARLEFGELNANEHKRTVVHERVRELKRT